MKNNRKSPHELRTFCRIGTQAGAQTKNSCVPAENANKINGFELSDGWLTQKEGAQLEGIPLRTFQYRCKANHYTKKRVGKGNGGDRIEVHIDCLPPEAIRRYSELVGIVKKPTEMALVNRDEAFKRRGEISLTHIIFEMLKP
jgi:hypothetical protein